VVLKIGFGTRQAVTATVMAGRLRAAFRWPVACDHDAGNSATKEEVFSSSSSSQLVARHRVLQELFSLALPHMDDAPTFALPIQSASNAHASDRPADELSGHVTYWHPCPA